MKVPSFWEHPGHGGGRPILITVKREALLSKDLPEQRKGPTHSAWEGRRAGVGCVSDGAGPPDAHSTGEPGRFWQP